jgi:branched-subunit amino acid transport protein
MSTLWLILGMGAGVYLLRLVGLSLQELTLPPAVDRALRCVPVALLTGLVVVGYVNFRSYNHPQCEC